MTPVKFPEANCAFGPPPGLAETQCGCIPGFNGQVIGGSCDGLPFIVVAYQPTQEEIEALAAGALLYFSMIGGVVPHYPSVSFEAAIHPA